MIDTHPLYIPPHCLPLTQHQLHGVLHSSLLSRMSPPCLRSHSVSLNAVTPGCNGDPKALATAGATFAYPERIIGS